MSHVEISDRNLRVAIETRLNKAADEPIDFDEMASLRELEIREAGVTRLNGLEHAKNLFHLKAGGNSVSHLDPLKDLINLRSIDMWGNTIQKLTPIEGLTNLQGLWFQGNRIADISPLEKPSQPRVS